MNEFRYYLGLLLEHRCGAGPQGCAECRSLQRIYEFMQTEIFSSIVFSETPMEPRQAARGGSNPANHATASPRPPLDA